MLTNAQQIHITTYSTDQKYQARLSYMQIWLHVISTLTHSYYENLKLWVFYTWFIWIAWNGINTLMKSWYSKILEDWQTTLCYFILLPKFSCKLCLFRIRSLLTKKLFRSCFQLRCWNLSLLLLCRAQRDITPEKCFMNHYNAVNLWEKTEKETF